MIAQNPRIAGVSRIPGLFGESARKGVAGHPRLYRPLAMSMLALDHTIYRGNPRGYHVTSIALHTAATMALYGLLIALGSGGTGAFVGALVFGVHPIHTEAVDVAFNRSEIMACLGVVAALWWLWHWLRTRRAVAWAGAAAIFFLALLSRESAVCLPVIAGLALFLLRPAASARDRLRGLLPLALFAVPFALYLWMRQSALGEPAGGILRSVGAEGIVGSRAPGLRLALVAETLRDYWRMLAWPWPLRASYEDYVPRLLGLALALHAALLTIALLAWRRFPTLTLGIAFFYLALLPSTRLFADPALQAERFVYLPSAGMAIPLAFAAAGLERRRGRGTVLAATFVLATVLGAVTWHRNAEWHSRQALWEAELRAGPRDWKVLLNLSQVRLAQGRFEEALALCNRGLGFAPLPSAFHSNRGLALLALGRSAEAEASLLKAARQDGGSAAYANLARAYVTTGRREEAESAYGKAEAVEPDEASRLALRGEMLLYCRHDLAAARRAFEAALALRPDLGSAQRGLRLTRQAS